MLEKLDSTLFDWQTWRAGTLMDLGVHTREIDILEKISILRKHALGYCDPETTPCRPKPYWAVMFWLPNGERFWTHLRAVEFEALKEEV